MPVLPLISLVFIVLGGAMIWVSVSSYMKKRRLAQIGVRTTGTVINVDWVSPGFNRRSIPQPTVRFQERSGQLIEFTVTEGTSLDSYTVGQNVEVTYNPQYPRQAYIGSPVSLGNIFFAFLGSIFAFLGIGFALPIISSWLI